MNALLIGFLLWAWSKHSASSDSDAPRVGSIRMLIEVPAGAVRDKVLARLRDSFGVNAAVPGLPQLIPGKVSLFNQDSKSVSVFVGAYFKHDKLGPLKAGIVDRLEHELQKISPHLDIRIMERTS